MSETINSPGSISIVPGNGILFQGVVSNSNGITFEAIQNYWNENSQKVADAVIKYGYNADVGLIHDLDEPGCMDYVGGLPCDQTYWTTSDSLPTGLILADYGYAAQSAAILAKLQSLNAFSAPNSGSRYEAYAGYAIVVGNPGDQHSVLMPPNGSTRICPSDKQNTATHQAPAWGNTSDGKPYKIQADIYSGHGAGTINPNGPVDVVGPQAIMAWMNGDMPMFTSLVQNLVNRYKASNYVGTGSTWQLGQVMFCMRIAGLDSSTDFTNMEALLWSLQSSEGYLPNTYSGVGKPGNGHDPENSDAGLLPFSTTLINSMKNSFGKFTAGKPK